MDSYNQGSCHNAWVQDGNPWTHDGQRMHPMDMCNTSDKQHNKTCSREIWQVWLCSKPRLQIVVHDNNTNFTNVEFQEMLSKYNIQVKQMAVKNPTANSLVKLIHSTHKVQLRTKNFGNNYIGEFFFRLLFLQSGQPCLPIEHTQLLNLHTEWIWSFVNRFTSTG